MRNIYTFLTFIFLLVFSFETFANEQIEGIIIDEKTNEPLSWVTVIVEETQDGTFSDIAGNFVLPKLDDGSYTILFSMIGYESKQISISIPLADSEILEISLSPAVTALDEIRVVSSILHSQRNYQPQTSFNRQELERRSDVSVAQMLDGEPGIAMRSFGAAPARPVIRGFDGERLLVLENGERMGDISESAADHAIALDPNATEAIEVIRGPAGLLFGNNAIGGVVNLVTNDLPTRVSPGTSGNVSFQAASVNDLLQGYARITHGWENQAITGRFSYREAGNIRTPEGRLADTASEAFEGTLGWGFQNDRMQAGFAIMGKYHAFEIPEALDDPDETIEIRYNRQGIQGHTYHNTNGFFQQITTRLHAARYFQQEIEIEIEDDGSVDEDVELEFDMLSLSTTISGVHGATIFSETGTVGLNIHTRRMAVGGDEAFTPGDFFINPALFTLQEVSVGQSSNVQFGARLDYRYIETRQNDLFPDINETKSDLNIAASIGFSSMLTDKISTGIQFARTHRYPTVTELYAFGPHIGAGVYEIGDPNLKTEISYGADAFLRGENGRLDWEIAGFYTLIDNFIAFQPLGTIDQNSGFPVFQYIGDDAEVFGGEFSVRALVTNQLTAEVGIDYVHGTRLNDDRDPLPFMPPFRSRIAMNYDYGQGFVSGNVRFVTAQNRVAPEEDETGGYVLAGLQAGYRLGHNDVHRIILRVDNLFDTKYRDHLSRIEDRNFPMPGRNISLMYSWIF